MPLKPEQIEKKSQFDATPGVPNWRFVLSAPQFCEASNLLLTELTIIHDVLSFNFFEGMI